MSRSREGLDVGDGDSDGNGFSTVGAKFGASVPVGNGVGEFVGCAQSGRKTGHGVGDGEIVGCAQFGTKTGHGEGEAVGCVQIG